MLHEILNYTKTFIQYLFCYSYYFWFFLILFNWGRNQKISPLCLYLHRPAFTSKVKILPTKKIFPHKNIKYFNIENILILYIQYGINLFDILKVFSIKRSYVRECDPPHPPQLYS